MYAWSHATNFWYADIQYLHNQNLISINTKKAYCIKAMYNRQTQQNHFFLRMENDTSAFSCSSAACTLRWYSFIGNVLVVRTDDESSKSSVLRWSDVGCIERLVSAHVLSHVDTSSSGSELICLCTNQQKIIHFLCVNHTIHTSEISTSCSG